MAEPVDSDPREVLRRARAHMDPNVYDRARVAQKLAATRSAWDGQQAVGGGPLPNPFGPEQQVAASALTAGKVSAVKWLLVAASVAAVGAGTLATQPAKHAAATREAQVARVQSAPVAAPPVVVVAAPAEAPPTAVLSVLPPDASSETRKVVRGATRTTKRRHAPDQTPHPQPLAPQATAGERVEPSAEREDPLSLDLRLLQEAAQALYARQPRYALQLLDRHAERFARSETRHERHALAFQAACALGDAATAEGHRQALLRDAKESALAARVRPGCGKGRP